MITQEQALLEKIKSLPLERQAEVEDFVEFLRLNRKEPVAFWKGFLVIQSDRLAKGRDWCKELEKSHSELSILFTGRGL